MLIPALLSFTGLSVLIFIFSNAIVRMRHLGQLFVDTNATLRNFNSFLLFLLVPIHILYLSLVYTSPTFNKQLYWESYVIYDALICVIITAQLICSVFLDQGLLYTIIEYILFLVSFVSEGREVHLFVVFVSLALTITKFVRSNTPPYPVVLTYGDIPIRKERQQDVDLDEVGLVMLPQPSGPSRSTLYRPKYEGVQLKKPNRV